MRSAFLGPIFITSLLMSPVANAWDLQKFKDAHNFVCGDFWEVNKEASGKTQVTIEEADVIELIGAAVANELYDQDALWVASGHKSYIHEISFKAIPKVGLKILVQCKKNPSKNMAEQVDDSFVNFATSHWNPYSDSEFNSILDK